MAKTLAEEAKEFKTQKKTPLDTSDKVALRFYMGNIIGGLVGHTTQSKEQVLQTAYELAKDLVQFEKDNF